MIDYILDDYKRITEEIIMRLRSNLEIDDMMENREKIINQLFSNDSFDKEYIKKIYIDKGILETDKNLKSEIEYQKQKIKSEIVKLRNIKNANNAYDKYKKINSFFNTKI